MKVTHITISVEGSYFADLIDLPEFTEQSILAHLGLKALPYPQVDSISTSAGAFMVELSQKKAWTYVKHIFVKTA